eukprot:TRINITY_DN16735_c0_g1_i1.p2 TRINITY_DN16735_c0_g1~~TRINITY_DN16735_c0_g1_i1.p2  ORF type:complete len:155 (-),score=23.10 TRINITY_DN16735_c0_g1_i1:59-523(-)
MYGISTEQVQYIADIDGLQSLTLEECSRTTRVDFPSSLRSLTIIDSGEAFELGTADIGALPEGLQTLRIASWCFDHPLGDLPEALEVLDLKDSSSFNRPLGQLPGGLKTLHLGKEFTRELGPLPPALKWLTLPLQYPHALAVPHTTHVAFVKHK